MLDTTRHEFRSPTQKPVYKISKEALEARKKGITNVRNLIQNNLGTEFAKELIASMNVSVAEATKELKKKAQKEKK